MEPGEQLSHVIDHGAWRITTETSIYTVDADRRVVTRYPIADTSEVEVVDLPKDGEPLPLLGPVGEVAVGFPMELRLGGLGEDETFRTTTLVQRIERV